MESCNWRWMIFSAWRAFAVEGADAYEPPNLKTVLFGGYSSVSIKPGTNLGRLSLNGWAVSVINYQFFSRWGLTAEFGGNGNRHRSYLFGGTFRSLQRKWFGLTARILAGGTTWDPKAPQSGAYREQTALTFGFGQSIDFKFSENVALRVQPDFRFVRFADPNGASKTSLVRPISAGFVYQFGRR